MIDPKLLREQPDAIARNLARRDAAFDTAAYAELEARRKKWQVRVEQLRADRNKLSKQIGVAAREGGDVDALKRQVEKATYGLSDAGGELKSVQASLRKIELDLPNLLDEAVPDGTDESANRELKRWGDPRPAGDDVQDHVALGEALGQMDFGAAARLAGARYTVLTGELAIMHRALIQFMLDLHVREHGYTEAYVPFIVNPESLIGTGQLPKFEQDLFGIESERSGYLVPTGEVPLTNLVAGQTVNEAELPLKYTAHTPCFRSEAGAYGKDTRGMLRQHQFEKVELVQITHPDHSDDALEELTRHAEIVLERLELPYRRVVLSSGDTGFSSAITYDLEVWLPGQDRYREISSCSNCRDFQARRMGARWKGRDARGFVHTLNGSGVAAGRALIAVIENYQHPDGSIVIPEALRPWMGGADRISA
ncbi:MAG: serine--tRNA ligase [Gammaproteobacteria bacterium]|nr:serine--tRNA ligase [Gammaproteobacteria bacterium]MYL00800.1 serine--tRNA ligase [Gammaproteobacteria bacterium]